MENICFHCGSDRIVWENDFDFDDYGYEGYGIVHVLHCQDCGAEIEYRVPYEPREED